MKNPAVVFLSLLALLFIVLMFVSSWFFIIPVLVIIFINQKLIMSKPKSKK